MNGPLLGNLGVRLEIDFPFEPAVLAGAETCGPPMESDQATVVTRKTCSLPAALKAGVHYTELMTTENSPTRLELNAVKLRECGEEHGQ